jgi:RNA polymerase sigma factor (sigma-70 family)
MGTKKRRKTLVNRKRITPLRTLEAKPRKKRFEIDTTPPAAPSTLPGADILRGRGIGWQQRGVSGWQLMTPAKEGPIVPLTQEMVATFVSLDGMSARMGKRWSEPSPADTAVMLAFQDAAAGNAPTNTEYEQRVRAICDGALGQPNSIIQQALRQLLDLPCDYRAIIEAEYPTLVWRLDHVESHDAYDTPKKPTRPMLGHNSGLTAEQREAITGKFDPKNRRWIVVGPLTPRGNKPSLFTSAAHRIAGRDNVERVAAVEAIGLQALERCALSWDPSRAKLWTYAKSRVEGAMKNFLRDGKPGKFYGYDEGHHHHSERDGDGWNGSAAQAKTDWRLTGKFEAPDEKKGPVPRNSTGGSKLNEPSWIEQETQQIADANPPETASKIDKAMAKLKPEERDAFRNRWMTAESLKLSRTRLARRWNVSPQYIYRLEKNAKRKLQKETGIQF